MATVITSVDEFSPVVAGEVVGLVITVTDDVGATVTPTEAPVVVFTDLDGQETTLTASSLTHPVAGPVWAADWQPVALGHHLVRWHVDGVSATDDVEVVGVLPVTPRKALGPGKELGSEERFRLPAVRAAIGRALARVENLAGVGVVPHRTRMRARAINGRYLALEVPAIRDVERVTAGGVDVDLTGWELTASDAVVLPSRVGTPFVDVTFEHGLDAPPPGLREALPDLVLDYLIPSAIDARATQLNTTDGASYSLALESAWKTGLPRVDAAIADLAGRYALGPRP